MNALTDNIDTLEEDISEDIKAHVATALDTAEGEAVTSVAKREVVNVQGVQLVTDGERDVGQLGISRVFPTTLLLIVSGALNSICVQEAVISSVASPLSMVQLTVDSLHGAILNEHEGCASIKDSGVSRALMCGAVDGIRRRGHLPETLRVIDGSVLHRLRRDVRVDVACCDAIVSA